MTQPNPDAEAKAKAEAEAKAKAEAEAKAKAEAEAKAKAEAEAKAKAKASVLDVVEYVHTDPILGGERSELGVIVAIDGEAVHVVPLAGHRVQVTPADVKRLTVDDV